MDKITPKLPDSAFVLLAVLTEGKAHGYALQQIVNTRGFQYWGNLGKTSIYGALKRLEVEGLVTSSLQEGGGPTRKLFQITRKGRQRLRSDTKRRLTMPEHPRNELDLGIYALPFLKDKGLQALQECLVWLRTREAFLVERLQYCRSRQLLLPALAFQRPLLALQAEIQWLESVAEILKTAPLSLRVEDWQHYEFLLPPSLSSE